LGLLAQRNLFEKDYFFFHLEGNPIFWIILIAFLANV